VVPGLEPTDGYAINATTPNLEPLAPALEVMKPIGPIMYALYKAMNTSEPRPTLPGHDLHNKTSLTVLVPNAHVSKAINPWDGWCRCAAARRINCFVPHKTRPNNTQPLGHHRKRDRQC